MKVLSYFVVGLLVFGGLTMIGSVSGAGESLNVDKNFSVPEVIEGEEFVEINVEGTNTYNYHIGQPRLPVYTETIVLPFGVKNFNFDCEVDQKETMDIALKVDPAPQRYVLGYEEIDMGPRMDPEVYGSTELFPDDWYSYYVGVGLDENMEHKTFLTINMYPVRYRPALDTIEYVTSIDVTVNYDDPGYNPFPATSSQDMVIIAPEKFVIDLEPLVAHKNSHGVTTVIKTTEDIYSEYTGVDKPEEIKKFIQDAMEEGGEIEGVKYILLVGGLNNLIYANPMDTENYGDRWWHLPVRWANLDYHEPGPVCDLYYADVYKTSGEFDDWNKDGDELIGEWKRFGGDKPDLYPDIALGRLACRNSDEVRSVVDKIINYENNAYGSDWFEKFITVTGDGFLDQDDLDFEWDTNGLPNGEYTIYAQSNNDEGEFGPTEEIDITIDKSKTTQLTFNHDDYTRIPNFPQYPTLPIAEIVSVSEGDNLGNTDYFYEPNEGEAYINDMLHWADVEYTNGLLHIRGKTYDPKPYGNMTDIHVWIKNSNGDIVFDDWRYNSLMFAEGDWTCGNKLLKGRAGANYYMPGNFNRELLWSSNGNWYEEQDVKDAISDGAGFVFFSGHGSPSVWANHFPGIPGNRHIGDVVGLRVVTIENGLPRYRMKELSNEYELPVIVVGGCHNSLFTVSLIPTFLNLYIDNNMHTYGLPTPECWSWWPVRQSKSGAIATIGNTGYGYGVLSEDCTSAGVDNWITTEFFVQYGTEGKEILGEAHAQAISSYIQEIRIKDEGDAKTVMQWVLLGDPSLKLGGYPPTAEVEISMRGIPGFYPGDTIELQAESQSGSVYEWSLDKDGDGIFDTFLTGQTIEEEWETPGIYWVKAESNDGTTGLTVVEIENQYPTKPSIIGPTRISIGQTYSYEISSSDPDGDELYYLVEWGDGDYTIIEPGDSTTVSHKFSKSSKIKVKAIDSGGLWAENVLSASSSPKNKLPNMPLLEVLNNLLERFFNFFHILWEFFGIVD